MAQYYEFSRTLNGQPLQFVSFKDNLLSEITLDSVYACCVDTLVHFDLSYNHIDSIDEITNATFDKLREFIITGNHLTSINFAEILQNWFEIEHIMVENNNLVSLPDPYR